MPRFVIRDMFISIISVLSNTLEINKKQYDIYVLFVHFLYIRIMIVMMVKTAFRIEHV